MSARSWFAFHRAHATLDAGPLARPVVRNFWEARRGGSGSGRVKGGPKKAGEP